MNALLVSIAGPQQGSVFELTTEEMSIGRDPTNELCIPDFSASRRHCLIRKEGSQFKIIDLESRNGTFVDDVPIRERILQNGDQIEIGDSLFLFVFTKSDSPQPPRLVPLDEGFTVVRTTVELRLQDTIYLQPNKVASDFPISTRIAEGFQSLLRFSKAISSIGKLEEFEKKLLDSIFEMIPAQRGAVLLKSENTDEVTCGYAQDTRSDSLQTNPFPISRTVIDRVLHERVAILCNDVGRDQAFQKVKSLAYTDVRSLLAVPLASFEKILGLIYLDTLESRISFDNDHLHLITAISAIASVALENIHHLARLQTENLRLMKDINIEHKMIGESSKIREVYEFIAKVATSKSTVLIYGESGTGKELVARAIHQNSPRSAKPFVAINCAALPETLLESELFGYERGAFTGATAQKKGKVEIADEGTLFLDEVAELSQILQAKLLRVLQEQEFDRLGGTQTVKVDVRFLAATNKDLEAAVKNGSFRQDLYYRLHVVSLNLPPLRERREDIPLLATYFAAKHAKKSKRKVIGISAEARSYLIQYDWPGNIRELENAIERAVVLGTLDLILPEDLPEVVLESPACQTIGVIQFYEGVKEAKKQIILKAVETAKGNYTEAAKLLGVHPNNLHRLIRNLNMKAVLKA